jgi:cytochrome b561
MAAAPAHIFIYRDRVMARMLPEQHPLAAITVCRGVL